MSDLLVKLYELEETWEFLKSQEAQSISIRKPLGPEVDLVTQWVKEHFDAGWASETQAALGNRPVSCFIAVTEGNMLGFACYDATALGMFGPTGVHEDARGKGTGKALLLACLLDMKLKGYQYAVIGSAGPVAFYEKLVGAIEIPDSSPGPYRELLDGER